MMKHEEQAQRGEARCPSRLLLPIRSAEAPGLGADRAASMR